MLIATSSLEVHPTPHPQFPPSNPLPPLPQPPAQLGARYAEPPPAYTPKAVFQPEDPLGVVGVGVPIQIQVEGGRTVAATLMQEPSGKHVVYIRDRQEGEGDESGNEKPAPPKEFLLLALVGILCCPLFGVIALLKALAVGRNYSQGNYAAATKASQQAHSWGAAAVVFGVCMYVIVFTLKMYLQSYRFKTNSYY